MSSKLSGLYRALGIDGIYPNPLVHDNQHWWASMAGMIAGLTVFVTYYFFSRMEGGKKWKMSFWYFIIGGILSAFTGSAIACVLSTSIRPREIIIVKKSS